VLDVVSDTVDWVIHEGVGCIVGFVLVGAAVVGGLAALVSLVSWLMSLPTFEAPGDVIVTAEGEVLVADPDAHQVLRVEDNGLEVVAGTGDDEVSADDAPSAEAPADATEVDLGEPVALAERDGVLFVADRELGAILRIDGEGRLQALPGPWRSPQLLAARSEGPVYAAVGGAADEAATQVLESAGRHGGAPLLADPPADGAIVGLAMSPDDEPVMWIEDDGLYIGDERIVSASGDGERRPVDISVGPEGDVAIVEPGDDDGVITVYRPDGGVRRRIELPWRPVAVALGDEDVIVLQESDPDPTFVYAVEPDLDLVRLGPLPSEDDNDTFPSDPFPPEPPPTFPPGPGFP
jgi:hypothetical protein